MGCLSLKDFAMSFFLSRTRPATSAAFDLLATLRRVWEEHRRREAARASLALLLDRGDDHLLDDIALDRETADQLLGDTLVLPHRGWDAWQGADPRPLRRTAEEPFD